MLFSSLEFLYLYLPITLLIYFLVPLRLRNAVLLVVSLIFYGWGEPMYVFLMIFTVLMDYAFGLAVEKYRSVNPQKSRALLIAAIVLNLALLGFFKYCDFLLINLAHIPALSFLRPLGLRMPIGISFYTFQALSYVIDVYRSDAPAQRNVVAFGTYVTLFPQLIAGPIVRYKDIDEQLTTREHSATLAASGARTFLCGLGKKVLLANTAGALWKAAVAVPDAERSVLCAWMGVFWYAIQIYLDFSGYSDMAIGLGKIFGFRFLENFHYPYTARSITDFWRRWHISLSDWFREYVYIPLGGNRVGRGRMYFNLFVVWFLTGFWHGANWNYILWGLFYFVLLVMEKAFLGRWLQRLPAAVGHVYTLFFVMIGWLIFAMENLSTGFSYWKTMFGGGSGFLGGGDLYALLRNAILAAICILACTPLPKRIFRRFYEKSRITAYAAAVGGLLLLLLCTAYLVDSSFNPFLYWNF